MFDLKSLNVWAAFLVACLSVGTIPMVASGLTNVMAPTFSHLDEDGVFAWLMVHHVLLLGLTMLAIFVVDRGKLSEWGFNLQKLPTSLLIIAGFIPAFSLIEFMYMSGRPYVTDFPQNSFNNLGWQGFQYFFSGLGEEPLFRGFIIVLMLNSLRTSNLSIRTQQVVAIAVSTVLFMYAHLDVDWLTFSVTHYDFSQLTKALQFGIFLGVVFVYTQSLLAPIILHGLANGITATIGFYLV